MANPRVLIGKVKMGVSQAAGFYLEGEASAAPKVVMSCDRLGGSLALHWKTCQPRRLLRCDSGL